MKKSTWWLLLMMIIVFSCTKEDEYDYPLIYTGEVTDITNDGAVFSAKIVDLGKLEVIEYGFVWDSITNPTIENSEKYIINTPPKIGVFNQHISTTLQAGEKYYVRTYIRNSKYITYGKAVVFTSLGSLAPQILNFTPKTGSLKDTLTIVGHNFSYITSNNQVQIGEFQATVIKANQDSLMIKVPEKLNLLSSPISVSIQGNKAVATDSFNLIPPVISDFIEKTGTFGSLVTIVGNNFLFSPTTLKVYFDSFNAKITDIQNQRITVVVPDSLDKRQSNIKVIMNNLTATSIDKFQLAALSIDDFTPKVATTGNIITLTGNNFSPIRGNNIVRIGGLKAAIGKASIDKLIVKVPLQDTGYPSRDVSISVEVIGETHDFNGTLLINDKWFRIKDSPISGEGLGYKSAHCFVSNDKAYIGLNNKSEFWEYTPSTDEWIRLADFPGISRSNGTGFVLNNKIYYGTGYHSTELKDWWEYNIDNNTWLQKNDFTGEKRTAATSFSFDNNGYLGTGYLWKLHSYHHGFFDFWKYNSSDDSWTKITDYPMCPNFGMWKGISVTNSTHSYIGLGNVRIVGGYEAWIYKYSPSNNSWQRISNFPYAGMFNDAIGFCFNDTIYIKTSHSTDFYYYDEGSDSWSKLQTDILTNCNMGIAFSIGNKVYVGLGGTNAIWEYDPSR